MTRPQSDLASNRKAYHDYEIIETFEAGIALLGSEVKSLRINGASLQEGYIRCEAGEMWLVGVGIAPYSHFSGSFVHEERRERKLLLHKREIIRLSSRIREKGLTLIPLALYLKGGKIKVKLGLGKGKRAYDKRKKLKEDEIKRDLKRAREL